MINIVTWGCGGAMGTIKYTLFGHDGHIFIQVTLKLLTKFIEKYVTGRRKGSDSLKYMYILDQDH